MNHIAGRRGPWGIQYIQATCNGDSEYYNNKP